MNDNTRIRIHLSGKLFEALTKQIILESKKSKKIIKETSIMVTLIARTKAP
jgi:hypothetical protein